MPRRAAPHARRRLPVDEIARRLVVSLHTARDHVERIQAQVGARSAPEPVARLFAEHYDRR